MVTLEEYLMGRDKLYPLTDQMKLDADITVERVNHLLERFGSYRKVTSGYRPAAINATIPNAAKHSNHMICRACDLHDPLGDLDKWCNDHLDILGEIGLWLEAEHTTPSWCHVQITPPASGHRVFLP